MHSLFVFNEFSSKKKKQQQSPVFIVLPFYLPFVMFFRSPVCDRTDHSHLEYVVFTQWIAFFRAFSLTPVTLLG